jgi:hypothetical protein
MLQSPKRQNPYSLVRVGVRTGTFNAAEPEKALPKYDLKINGTLFVLLK